MIVEQTRSEPDPDSGPSRTSKEREPSSLQQANDDESSQVDTQSEDARSGSGARRSSDA